MYVAQIYVRCDERQKKVDVTTMLFSLNSHRDMAADRSSGSASMCYEMMLK